MGAVARMPAIANLPLKDLYAVGEIPPLGHVPAKMHTWAIRKERHGAPGFLAYAEICERDRREEGDRRQGHASRAGLPRNGVGDNPSEDEAGDARESVGDRRNRGRHPHTYPSSLPD